MTTKTRAPLLALAFLAAGLLRAAASERPNIILAMADDMGWHNLSTYGNDRVKTPNIDRLAKEGLKMTQFYSASAVCTPTRASVLTGRYPLRFGITGHFNDRGPLKGGKTDLHEGGIRVAGLARWPGRIQAGAESGVLGHTNDLLPTLSAAGGAEIPGDAKLDGVNLLPLLTGKADSVERGTVFWQIRHYRNMQRHDPKPKPYATEIARKGKWKLLAKGGEPVELFDIESDLLEKRNVLEANPEVVGSLKKELQEWLAEPRSKFGNIPK